jgi:hypothetical protein
MVGWGEPCNPQYCFIFEEIWMKRGVISSEALALGRCWWFGKSCFKWESLHFCLDQKARFFRILQCSSILA